MKFENLKGLAQKVKWKPERANPKNQMKTWKGSPKNVVEKFLKTKKLSES